MADEDVLSIRMATLKTLNRSFRSLIATDVRRAAASIKAPTLILNSADDRIIDPAQGELLAKALPGAKRAVFPKIGHCAQLEDPLLFNLAVMKFLQDEPRAFRPRQW
jgi:pimeloyl-ACP methyl ester carboxylesterase